MAKAVVDRLEAAEIQEKHREVDLVALLCPLEHLFEDVEEIVAVGQSGESIVISRVSKPFVALLQGFAGQL